MARSQFQSRRRRSTPNRGWSGGIPAVVTVVPAASKIILSTITLDNDGIDETLLRTVGNVSVASDQVAGSEEQHGAVGICLVTDTALALGITALPDPVTDVADDIWVFFQSFAQQLTLFSSVGANPNMATVYPFDQRGKRIMHSGQSMVLIAANAHASAGYKITVNMRQLFMV